MNLINHLDKNNLHHAYLIEGESDKIIPEIFKFIESLGVETSQNPDFCHISVDSFKIDDARNLKSVEYEKSFSNNKKIFLISANNFLLEAQNTLLKIFEDPIENTHFFLIVPNKNILLKTLLSRFYLISENTNKSNFKERELEGVEKFIKMSLKERLDFIKELITEKDNENDVMEVSNVRVNSLRFLDILEFVLQDKFLEDSYVQDFYKLIFPHIFKVRGFINQPGSSLKTLMESVALIVPNF